jgi:hypothetical protein
MQGTGSASIFLKFRATSVGAITFFKKKKKKKNEDVDYCR